VERPAKASTALIGKWTAGNGHQVAAIQLPVPSVGTADVASSSTTRARTQVAEHVIRRLNTPPKQIVTLSTSVEHRNLAAALASLHVQPALHDAFHAAVNQCMRSRAPLSLTQQVELFRELRHACTFARPAARVVPYAFA